MKQARADQHKRARLITVQGRHRAYRARTRGGALDREVRGPVGRAPAGWSGGVRGQHVSVSGGHGLGSAHSGRLRSILLPVVMQSAKR